MSQQENSSLPDRAGSDFSRGRNIVDVTVVLLEDGYASTAIAPIEVFHSAGLLWNTLRGGTPEPRFRVTTASVDGKPVNSVCGIGLTPHRSIDEITNTDIIVLSASGLDVQERIARNTPLLPWLRKWHDSGAYIAAICSGSAFLAEAGLLDGQPATSHWGLAEDLRQRYPNVDWQEDRFITESGRLLCSGGLYASIDLSLYLVEKCCGHEIALQCAKSLLVSMPRHLQAGYAVVPISRAHSDATVRAAEDFMQQNFRSDFSTEDLAERFGISARTLIRRFKAATGHLPGGYLQLLRVAAAKEMLEQGAASIQQVSCAVGYQDAAFFRAIFKRQTGMTPAEYRHRFTGMSYRSAAQA